MDTKYKAPKDHVWVCLACGKKSKDRRGEPESLWDESCFCNAILVNLTKKRLVENEYGRVVAIVNKDMDPETFMQGDILS